jgi:hypothetical protein
MFATDRMNEFDRAGVGKAASVGTVEPYFLFRVDSWG